VAEDALAQLERRRLVAAHSPRYSLRGVSAAAIEQRWGDGVLATADHSLHHFTEWVAARRRDLPGLLDQSEALLALQGWAVRQGRPAEAITLGRGLSATLAWDRRWGRWRDVLETVLDSARQVQDRRDEAWALHQLGTRAAALGELPQGVALLREALAIREEGGSPSETALTRHNLDVALRLGAPPPGGIPHLPLLIVGGLLLAVAGLGAAYLATRSESVSVAVVTSGRGTVTSDPAGIDCGAACTLDVNEGTRVTLTATAQRGQVFAGWQGGACSGTRPCTITVNRDTTLEARFEPGRGTHVLDVETSGEGGAVTSQPSGIDCGRSCRSSFAEGTRVTLAAASDERGTFEGWRGDCSGTGSCTITMTEARSVTAVFRARPTLTVSKGESRLPSLVTSEPKGIDCGPTCAARFDRGSRVTLTFMGRFLGWDGPCEPEPTTTTTATRTTPAPVARATTPGTSTCVVLLTEDTTVTARFLPP
jgi:hypothetical protein